MPKKTHREFYIEGRMCLTVGITISAKSLEDAFTRAKDLQITDFVDILGDHCDSTFAVSGVFYATALPEV